ncbi:DNA processing protein [uncultured Gammaproteobacteria bacterium]
MITPTCQLSDAERLDWLRLIRSENVGPITFRRLLERCRSIDAALKALPDLARKGGRTQPLRIASRAEAERELEANARLGARLIASCEPDYPPLLAAIEDAPPLISVLGHAHLLQRRAVALVGARNASLNGRRFAETVARDLGGDGWLVVSGLARGIDAAAHTGALESGTVAVVAGGVDVIYPEENEALYHRIVELGVIVAESPIGSKPQARHFPRRNRLISGLSLGVAVIEASPNSGSLITTRFALEQGREVFAVPGSPLDPRCRGTNALLKQGATLIESAADITAVLGAAARKPLGEPVVADRFEAPTAAAADGAAVERARAKIMESLAPTPVSVDELVRDCHVSLPVVLTVILELELAGRVERQPGNQVNLL